MSKWTEEPWAVNRNTQVFAEHEHVASVTGQTREQAQSNARLISMAPTMARKLSYAVEWLEVELKETGDRLDAGWYSKLRRLYVDLAETLRRLEE